jgi:hypothetical protein
MEKYPLLIMSFKHLPTCELTTIEKIVAVSKVCPWYQKIHHPSLYIYSYAAATNLIGQL